MTYEQIHNLFKQRYNQSNWKQFLGEAFANTRLLAKPEILTGIDSNVASQVQKLGYITLNENGIERQIAVYEVTLAQGIILERNRVGLRHLLRKYWKDIDAAFIAYHRPETPNWRFTYVSELTGYDADGEFVKIKTEPKRYTYVLGEGESTRTAAERFTAIASKGSKATLDDVKEAFSVEKLSKAFFDEYKKHYDIFCDFMVSKPNIRQTIFNGDEKGIRDFNKKLLGRIVFLYFIQKKGWLGVPAKSDWGKGDFDFLTNLFKNTKNPDLFYSELLSKLFFDTLNTKRKDDLIELVKGEPCRIPYLNGGLFEEDDKKHRNLIFPANLFKSLFDFFNQYNFTIYEDDPNDHTVAVDPEMLGHIFENLLEDNKDKGAYYTPKEIVHYMCQESLIEYLTTWFENKGYEVTGYIGFDKPDQPKLFSSNEGRKGQLVIETDNKATGKQIDRLLIEKLLKKKLDDDDKKLIKKHSAEFHTALDSVKICDPAIGSGAFPMGLLHEIFTAKQTLHTFKHGNTKTFDASGVKLNIIQNSIYGVDIEKGAVDIARLRFWLSLIVDEEKPKALPNLDYKIVVGNSLVSKLGDDIIDIDWNLKGSVGKADEYVQKLKKALAELTRKQKDYFEADDKSQLKAEIRNLKIEILINQLSFNKERYANHNNIKVDMGFGLKPAEVKKNLDIKFQLAGFDNTLKGLNKLKNKPELPLHYFDWRLDFPEVLNEMINPNCGFDVIVMNPPYIGEKGNKDKFQLVKQTALGKYYQKKMDYFYFFFHQAINISKHNGFISGITTNYYVTATGATQLRNDLKARTSITKFVNFGESKVFPSALGQHNLITFLSRKQIDNPTEVITVNKQGLIDSLAFNNIFNRNDSDTTIQFVNKTKLFDGNDSYIRIVTTGNINSDSKIEAILGKIKEAGTELGTICEVNQGLRTGADKVSPKHITEYGENRNYDLGDGIFILKKSEIDSLDLLPAEKKRIKNLFKNSDIDKYVVNEHTNLKLIDIFWPNDRNINLKEFPNLIGHLKKFKAILEGRKENANGLDKAMAKGLFYFGAVRRKLDFSLPKIVSPQRSKRNVFGYTEKEWFASADVYYITDSSGKQNLKYILALLNSNLYYVWLSHKGKVKGNMLELYQKPLSETPIFQAPKNIQSKLEKLIDKIIAKKLIEQDITDLQQQIDNLVYKLYELTYDEVKVIDPEFSLSKKEYEALKLE